MDCFLLLNQAGIATELLGAGYIVWCSYRTKTIMQKQKVTYDGFSAAIEELLKASILQFRDQTWGFVLIAIGLGMQFLTGFK